MADATQFTFDLREVTTALIKQQGLHEGNWMAAFEFTLGAGLIGPTPAEAWPSALVQAKTVLLVRQTVPLSHPHLTVDAAEVNPAPSK